MSTIKVDTLVAADGSSAVTLTKQSAAKSWFQVDGTGTATIDGSFNTSGLVDEGTGQYTISFTNSMSDTHYAFTQGLEYTYSGSLVLATYTEASKVTGSCRAIHNAASGGASVDVPETSGNIDGDLA